LETVVVAVVKALCLLLMRAADESLQFRDDERVDYSHVISLKHVGDTLNLKILRDGEVRSRSASG
jgi:hypothetical protein